ncbi:penicillin-binding transpeptidase domain-containing protein [Bdellovibrio sp. HCB337]|uniref:penicillin-binding transpeptidase domain-containing protein n=1 Tax=Bdellovibrio sp. HCB337 TaxID=3394358 RepID=UPI0039A63501
MKSRIILVFAGVMVLWGALILRAAYLQFLPNEKLQSLQNRQFQTVVTLQARRGAIIDRNGRDLAMSATAYSLYADPKILEKKKQLAKNIAKELGVSTESVFSKIKDSNKRFVWIQRLMDEEKANKIKSWNIRGLSFVEEWRRVYPNESLLAHTLGFLGSEGQGLEGLEKSFETELKGNSKKVSVRRDARGRPLIADGLLFTENPDGNELKLTVDSDIQYNLENELAQAVANFEADSAVGVILDAQTSAIVAMASVPTFDVNKAMKTAPELRRDKAATDAFEPGSTLKTIVIASALRQGNIAPNTKFFCENGSFKVGDKVIREAETHENFGNLTVSEILAVSSNIGTTKIAFKMGDDSLRQGLLDFGFGNKLGSDLAGEARGTVQALPWRPHLLSNISFGHGIAVTPLQLANAYAAIANGGVLNAPYIVQSIRDNETGQVKNIDPKPIRRVLTPEQASQMKMMLSAVTTDGGTGKNARVDGFIVAGKTGTAQKVNPNGRGYIKGGYISSFAGFIPSNNPKFVIYVAVDHPRKAFYGAQVAAPIFSRVASYAVRKEGLAPVLLSEKNLLPEKRKAIKMDGEKSRGLAAVTEGDIVTTSLDLGVVPDVTNMTLREVLRRFSGKEISVKFRGQGLVSGVEPPVGAPLPDSKEITVILR